MAKNQFKRYTRSKFGTAVIATFLTVFGLYMLLPMIYLIISSLKPLDEILAFPPKFYVTRPVLTNYADLPRLLSNLWIPFSRYLLNSVFVSIVTTALNVFVSAMAAFTLSKYKSKFFTICFVAIQMALLFNGYTLAIPQYVIMSKLHMLNTYAVYILPSIASTLGVFLVKQYMDSSVPDTLLEAAKIDGATCFQTFFRIAFPLVKPAILTLVLFAFKDMWSMGSSATVFDEELKLLPNAISQISAAGITRTGTTMASTVIMMIPPILVYLISQSSITQTMSSSGIKG